MTYDYLDAVTGIPEPATPTLFAIGLFGILRRRRAAADSARFHDTDNQALPPGTIRAAARLGHDTIDSRNLSLLLTCRTADD